MKKPIKKRWFIIPAVSAYALFVHGKHKKPRETARIGCEGQNFSDGFLWGIMEYPYYEEDRTKMTLSEKKYYNTHRMEFEWSLLEPEEGVYSEKAWADYEKMLSALKKEGFTVVANLGHFTLPEWAYRQDGWENPLVMKRWEQYAAECGRRFGRYIDYWSTMTDPQKYVEGAYLSGIFPPHVRDKKRALAVLKNLLYAHARAYHAIKEFGKGDNAEKSPQVGLIYTYQYLESAGSFADNKMRNLADNLYNQIFPDALHTGIFDINIPGLYGETVKDDFFKETMDWLGINYFTRKVVAFNPVKPLGINQGKPVKKNKNVSTEEWRIFPEGIYHAGKSVYSRYNIPVMITENGLADDREAHKSRFLLDHLVWLHRLVGEGYPVIGYIYWNLSDSLQWNEETYPEKAELCSTKQDGRKEKGGGKDDRGEEGGKDAETVPESIRLFRFIAGNNRLPENAEIETLK